MPTQKANSPILLFLAMLIGFIRPSYAQQAPSQIAPAQTTREANATAQTHPSSSPTNNTNAVNKTQDAARYTAVAEQPVQEDNFDLLELRVKGNTLLEDTVIERTVYPFLGPKKSIDNVESARKALEGAYHSKGYQTVSVDIPEQNVENGVVYLQVIQGQVSRLRVTESHYFSLGKIKDSVSEVAEGKVPNLPVMQKQLEALSNQSSDRSITPILRAGDTPGTLEVDLKVKDELPLHGRIELNGRNTASTSRLRLVNSIHYDNLWQRMHSATLMYQVSPENADEVDVWAGTYAMPLPISDAKLALYAVSSSSSSSIANTGGTSVIGIGQIYGIRLIKPLPGIDKYSHSLTLGADYKDFQEDVKPIGSDSSFSTPISYLPFLLQYSSSIFDKDWEASFTVGLNFHLRGVGGDSNSQKKDANGNVIYVDKDNNELKNGKSRETPPGAEGIKITGEFENKRIGAQPNYAYLSLDAGFNHDLPYEMQFASVFSAQVADSPLISNEQFSLGGMNSVRGYFETQALSDDGFTGSLEVRSMRLAPLSMDYIDKLQALLFVDGGYGRVQEALPGQPGSYSLASTGLGVRFQMWKYFQCVLDLGFPLLDLGDVKAGHPKFHFSIATEF